MGAEEDPRVQQFISEKRSAGIQHIEWLSLSVEAGMEFLW